MGVRRGHKRFLPAALLAILSFWGLALTLHCAKRIVAFAQLFGIFKDHAGVRITQDEIFASYNSTNSEIQSPPVPRIIHKIFHNWSNPDDDSLPADWQPEHQTCLDFNPDWEHMLWTTKSSEEFIRKEFRWFLSTYKSYKYPVQRVDAMKYFALRHYGGIYIDMDNGCSANLDPLTLYPAFTTDGGHGALSNNIIGGQPGHPYFVLLTENLMLWKVNYLLPYVTIMFCSGQWFSTAMWEKYHSLLSSDGSLRGIAGAGWNPLHRVLMDMRPGADPWVFFTQTQGESWADWDYTLLKTIGDHIVLFISFLTALVGFLIWSCVRFRARSNIDDREHKKMDA
ncbi:hypothetical protein N7510_007378 [Penicillium lagena]|uniref:uncharacterized protein n=1 Tax=Penicillium lagena TaxID=94218 RepID=UPI00253FB273|nr:uncharacterized protein N7510_007378 [Penicillium lagena]KAJ5610659.1 hypothetical protein N7510_007378 [Penicillium lagena]